LPVIDPQTLVVLVFGPGYGELALVHAPPGKWLVVDGCGADREGYAQQALTHYEAAPSLVMLSHPHRDHVRGLREVIENATKDPLAEWPLLGMVPAPETVGAGDKWDAVAALEGGVAEQVIATILDRWQRKPACKWLLELGASQPLGEALVRVLSPTDIERDAALKAWLAGNKRYDFNRAATALLVSWRGRRVLLGSDLVEDPGNGWSAATGQDDNLRAHDGYKVAHHTSRRAIAAQVERPNAPRLRSWFATPYPGAYGGLPRFDDGEAMDRLLAIEDPIYLTGLPREHAEQSGALEQLSRGALRDEPDRAFATPAAGFPDCFVALVLSETGLPTIVRGPGSVRVMA
jgi:hypothetical protein